MTGCIPTGRVSFGVLGFSTFGIGTTLDIFNMVGIEPEIMNELNRLAIAIQKYSENNSKLTMYAHIPRGSRDFES